MLLNHGNRALAVSGIALLLFASGAWSAEEKGVAKTHLGPAQRLPIPDKVEISRIAPSDRSLWFLGWDRGVDPAVPVLYSWSAEGIRQYDVPKPADVASTQAPSLAVSRNGEALLLVGGQLYGASGTTFSALNQVSKSPVAKIEGRDGFWIIQADGDLLYLANLADLPKRIGHTDKAVTATNMTASGDLWFATEGGRIYLASHEGGTLKPLAGTAEAQVSALYSDGSEQLWIAYADGRVARSVAGSTDWFTADEGLPGWAAREITEDSWGNFVLSFSQSEAEMPWLITQPRNMRSNLGVQFRRLNLEGLTGAVRTVAVDHLGGTWVSVGTLGAFRLQGLAEMNWPRGAAAANDANAAITQAIAAAAFANAKNVQKSALSGVNFPALPGARMTHLNSSKGLPNNFTSCIVADNQNNVYFTTGYVGFGAENESVAGGGVAKWDHRQFTSLAGLASTTNQACAFDAGTGSVWFGGTNGVSKYNVSSGAVQNFLAGQTVMDVNVRGADVWVATWSGVYKLTAATGTTAATYSTGGKKANGIAFDTGAVLWAATESGLYRFNGSAFTAEGDAKVAGQFLNDVEADDAGNIWMANWYGAYVRRSSAGTYTSQSFGPTVNGINRAYHINKDNAGNLWFAHGNFGGNAPASGVSFLPAAQASAASVAASVVLYTTANGLPNNSIIYTAQEAGAYWFGLPGNGVVRFGGPLDAPGFPKTLTGVPDYNSPLLVDLDLDRKLDIVVADRSGFIYAFKSDGTPLWTVDVRNAITPISRGGITVGTTPGNPLIQSSAAAGDVDGDGDIDVVIGVGGIIGSPSENGQGGVVILSRLGAVKRFLYTEDIKGYFGAAAGPGMPPKSDGFTESVFATPVLANLDADPELEIVVGGLDNLFYAWNGNGTPIYQKDDDNDGRLDEDGLGDTTPNTPFDSTDDAPGIKGVDDDGDGQIDEGGAAFNSDDDEDGRLDEDYPEWPFNARDTVLASAVVYDLNGDADKEIIVGHDYSGGSEQEFNRGGVLRVLNSRGQQVSGFPKGNLEQVIWSSPVVADLNNDGTYEILHGTGPELETVGNAPSDLLVGQLVYAWRANGTPYIAANANGRFATTEGRSFASFAVGDLDNDGSPELVIITQVLLNKSNQPIDATGNVTSAANALGQKLYAFKADGSLMPGFPVRPVPFFPTALSVGSPVLADVNGDGFLDIIVPVRKGPIVFDRTGHVLPGMGPFESLEDDLGSLQVTGTPAVADLDGDGNVELIWTVPNTTDNGGQLRVVRMGAANNALYARSWPQWRRTVNRNAVFGPIISVVQGWESAGTLNINVQAMTGQNAIASVTADLRAVGGAQAAALTVQTNSYFFGTQAVSAVAAGRYEIPVTVRDALNRTDTQTLIYVKRGGTKSLSFSQNSLDFGTTNQGQVSSRQLTVVNTGTQVVTITSVTSTNAEFIPAVQNTPTPVVFSWTGLQMPLTLQPGASTSFFVRFRPGAGSGARNASLTITSEDAAGPRTIAMTGSTIIGNAGCSVSINPPISSVVAEGYASTLAITTSPAGCPWSISSDTRWLEMFPTSGNGSTTVYWSARPNFTVQTRVGTISINGTVMTVVQQRSGRTEDERFVSALYYAFLGRLPTDAELQYRVGQLTSASLTRAQMAESFRNTPEFDQAGKFIAGLYVGILNRNAEYGGWIFQRNALAIGGASKNTTVGLFINGAEGQLSYGGLSNQNFVRTLYRQILLREASQAEVDFQASTLSDSQSRTNMATNFLDSAEFRIGTGPRLYAFLLYATLLQRDPTPAEFNALVTRISTAGDANAAIAAFITETINGSYEFRRTIL